MEPVVNFPCRIVWKLGKTIKFRISIDVSSLSSRHHTVIFRFFAIAIWRYISFSDLTNPNAHGPVRTKSDFAYIGPQQWIIDIMMIYEYLWWFVNFMIYPNLINLADAKSYGSKSTSFNHTMRNVRVTPAMILCSSGRMVFQHVSAPDT